MHTDRSRKAAHERGLEAARKRLWPHGNAPRPPVPASLAPPASPADDRDAPTLPFKLRVPVLAARAPRRSAVGAAAVVLVAGGLLMGIDEPGARESTGPTWAMPPLENLTVRGAIRIVDAEGNVVGVFGHVPSESGAGQTMALALGSPAEGGMRETLRLESLRSGATLLLQTPDRSASMTLVSGNAGPYVVLAQGSRQRVIGADAGDALPAVSAGPAARELDLLDPRAQPLGEGLSAVNLRVRGRKLRGRILNTTSVRHSGVAVDLALGDQHVALQVPVISPGNSTGFAVDLPPGIPESLLRSARVGSVTSTLRFDAHQPGSESARLR